MKAFRIISSDKLLVTEFLARLEFLNKGAKLGFSPSDANFNETNNLKEVAPKCILWSVYSQNGPSFLQNRLSLKQQLSLKLNTLC